MVKVISQQEQRRDRNQHAAPETVGLRGEPELRPAPGTTLRPQTS